MNHNLSLLKALLDTSTIEKVKALIVSPAKTVKLEMYDLDFRLLKTSANTINLEVITALDVDVPEAIQIDVFEGYSCEIHMFFQPIGFFTFDSEVKANISSLTFLHLLEDAFKNMHRKEYEHINFPIHKMTLFANALIGAFSIEGLLASKKNEDTSFTANGLDYDIFISNSGQLVGYLDDKYQFEQALVIYPDNINKTVDPVYAVEEMFEELIPFDLFTITKVIALR